MSTDAVAARRSISNFATLIAAITAPLLAAVLVYQGVPIGWAAGFALASVILTRGLTDVLLKRMVEQPDLFGVDDPELRAEDALRKRRLHFWRTIAKLTPLWALLAWQGPHVWALLHNPQLMVQLIILPGFMLMNFVILFGPMMMMGVSQIRGFEPGDASWGVKLDDVRGQKEAKEEIRKIITLWQSGEKFAKAGGKRERGILFLGAPGTGKTMLAKAIATGFNCPIVTIPGSGFAQTFIGMDVIIVRFMARKARKLAAKWGGQCIVFIDEIDAVGMRRSALGSNVSVGKNLAPQMPGGMMGGGGGMALNQLLVVMDGIDSPPFFRRLLVNRVNTLLDASYVIPQKVRGWKLRLPQAKPTGTQIFFVGATNVPLEALDPALVRAGRMGRHIYFRQPTKRDRIDVFDLYLGKVSHEAALDTDDAREELARVTNGYSPAEIEQVCSLALTYAHHGGRDAFSRADILEAMVTLEAGTALGWGYDSAKEERSTAIHEAGHAICSYLFMDGYESTRLSIRRRGATGGHHQAAQIEERSFKFRDELISDLIWGLGAYAAELVFYGNTTQGVGGDLGQTSYAAGTMVGRWGMTAPAMSTFNRERCERIGSRLLAAAGPNDVKLPRDKQLDEAALMGYAFVTAYNTIIGNKAAVEKVTERILREKEIYGDDLLKLLDSCGLEKPEMNWHMVDGPEHWPIELNEARPAQPAAALR